jgi:hypothetical protein
MSNQVQSLQEYTPPWDRAYLVRTNCCKCHALIKETPCPFCGAENFIEYGPEFEAALKEYRDDENVNDN